ncbi:MAG: hypothetical protein HZA53_03575 [Planctomycetes bacterium]|nr:hypothetical protein [Planctomycetota bacterium]
MKSPTILEVSGWLQTLGLTRADGRELRILAPFHEHRELAEQLLRWLADYMQTSTRPVLVGETVVCGYAVLKLDSSDPAYLDLHELINDGSESRLGVSGTLRVFDEQRRACVNAGVAYDPPSPARLAAVGEGVLDGLPAWGMRIPSPDHMSGWWIGTERTAEDYSNVRPVHLYHVTNSRPDLVKFLALSTGCRFDQRDQDRAWFDAELLDSDE